MKLLSGALLLVTGLASPLGWADNSNYGSPTTTGNYSSPVIDDHTDYQNHANTDMNQAAGTAEMTGTSEQQAPRAPSNGLRDEVVGIKPQIGAMNFKDYTGATQNRAAVGLTADMNVLALISNMNGSDDLKTFYLGPSSGVIFSHVGATDANFIGTNSNSNSGYSGPNLLNIPLNLKAGVNIGAFRIAAHGGGNLLYRSTASAVALGSTSASDGNSDWSIFPNVGGDLEFGSTNGVGVIIRPDFTLISNGNGIFTGTVGLIAPFG